MLGFNGGRIGSKNVIEQNGIVEPSSDPNYDDVGLILNGGDFVDGSKYAATVTATGVDLSATQNFNRDSYSVLDGDVFTVPDQGQFDLSTNDFTIEGWVYRYSVSSNNTFRNIFGKRRGSGGLVRYVYFTLYTGNRFFFYGTSTGSSWDIASGLDTGVALGADTWTHYAVCRQGSSIRIFIAGTLATTITTTASILNDSTAPFQIGTDGSANAFDGGRLAGIRVTNGTARYTANFTPPTAVFDTETTGFKASGVWTIPEVSRLRRDLVWPGDNPAQLTLTNLVLYLDAGNTTSYPGTGTTWTDLSNNSNNATLNNGPTFDSANGGSIVTDGSNDFIQTSAQMFNPNSDFSVSFFVKRIGSGGSLIANTSSGSFQIQLSGNLNVVDSFIVLMGSFSSVTVANTWYNLCLVRSGNTYTLYRNGSVFGSFSSSNTFSRGPNVLGKNVNVEFWNGHYGVILCYNRALTASEVTENFDVFKGRYGL